LPALFDATLSGMRLAFNAMMSSALPFKRLSFFYALYFALLGCIAPYWGLFLQSRAFDPEQIGQLMACFGLVRILAHNLWAYWSRYFRSPMQMVRTAGVLTMLCFSLIWWADSFWTMAAVMILYGFFWAAMLPQYEAMTLQHCGTQVEAYGQIRMWGSIGFVLVVLGAGYLFELVSVGWLPVVMLTLMALIGINSLTLPEADASNRKHSAPGQFLNVLKSRPVQVFILMNILLQISHGPYYTFFSIYLENHGYKPAQIGLLWSLGVMAEVFLFWKFHRVVNFFSWRTWCVLSLLITAVRWTLIGSLVDFWGWLILAQLGHAFSFAAMHAISMRYIQHLFPQQLQARAQALYSSVGFGIGGAIGAWVSGSLWQLWGGSQVFFLATLAALLGALVAWKGLKATES